MRISVRGLSDKNHNPRKGTETFTTSIASFLLLRGDKNHNPRKGTETIVIFLLSFLGLG